VVTSQRFFLQKAASQGTDFSQCNV